MTENRCRSCSQHERIADLRARLAENEVAFRKMAEAAEAYSRELHKAKAALARVLAVPACRDAGHVETLHLAARCCDPYETPCEAFNVSIRGVPGDSEGRPQDEEAASVCCYDGQRPCEYPQC